MTNTVLIVGATGVVGGAAVRRFLQDPEWTVIGMSRRRPAEFDGTAFVHLPADLNDRAALVDVLSDVPRVTHVVYAANYEKPGLVQGWSDPEHAERNARMFENLLGALVDVDAPLAHVTALQGTKAYGVHVGHRMRVPSKESQPRVEHSNFYFLQQDHLAEIASRRGFSWTVFRPQIIFGLETGTSMNLVPVIGIYAALRRRQGLPFSFPGGVPFVAEAVDARLLADAIHWAATAPTARDEVFNITNGDVFDWRDVWPALADELGVELGEDESLSIAEWLPEQVDEWRTIAHEDDLAQDDVLGIVGESHHYADFLFGYGNDGRDASPVFVSTVKLRQAGFGEAIDTEQMFRELIREARDRRIFP